MKRWSIAVLLLTALAVACGDGGAADELATLSVEHESLRQEHDSLATERDNLARDHESLQGKHDDLAIEQDRLTDERDALAIERDSLKRERDRLLSERDGLRRSNAELAAEVRTVTAEMERLRDLYDPQIRAEREALIEAEFTRACQVAVEEYARPVGAIVRWDSDWETATTKEDLTARVEECAAPERNKTAAQREAERLAACETIDLGQIEKGRSSLEGECFVTFARVVQFDTATGACSFHAEILNWYSAHSWDYDVRSTFGYHDDELLSAFETDCPDLDNVDDGDFIKAWVTYLGVYSYDTTAGGTNHVPSFRIEKVELVRKD